MSDKLSKNHVQELKEMVKEKKPNEPVEEVLAIFCQRHGLSMDTCNLYYNELVKEGKIKEK